MQNMIFLNSLNFSEKYDLNMLLIGSMRFTKTLETI